MGQGEPKTAQKSNNLCKNSGFLATQSKNYTLDNMFWIFFGLKGTISIFKYKRFKTNLATTCDEVQIYITPGAAPGCLMRGGNMPQSNTGFFLDKQ